MDKRLYYVLKSKILLFVAVLGFPFLSLSQKNLQLRSTISSAGAIANLQLGEDSFFIQQSIGQAGVIGTFFTNEFGIRQGFLQPLDRHAFSTSNLESEALALSVFPNPFSDVLVIEFQEELIDPFTTVKMYTSDGKLIVEKKVETTQKLTLNLQSYELAKGVYYLHITIGKKRKIVKIIQG